MHPSSLDNMQRCFDWYIANWAADRESLTVLDVGSADVNGSYRAVFAHDRFRYIGIDVEPGAGVDLVAADSYHLPVPDSHADIVISGQSLEHCEFFWLAFRDMVRVLKPDGFLFLIVPSSGPIHRFPVDCYRFYPDALVALAKYAQCPLLDFWLDDRGPWNDLVGVFSRREQPKAVRPKPTRSEQLAAPASSDPAEEAKRGTTPYLSVLENLHDNLAPEVYVEIGVRHGHSLRLAKHEAIGIDPWPEVVEPLSATTQIWQGASDVFFEDAASFALSNKVDLAFVDGMHLFEYALRDFMNLERHAHAGTVVVIDDVLPNHPAQAERSRRTQVWTGDVWKLIPCLRLYRPDLLLVTVDAHPSGLLLILGLDPQNQVLRQSYNPIVSSFVKAPAAPPVELLERRGATDPLLPELTELLKGCRKARRDRQLVQRAIGAWRSR